MFGNAYAVRCAYTCGRIGDGMTQTSREFGVAVCEQLGIPANVVRSFTIHVDARDVLTIDVTLVPKKLGAEWYEILTKLREEGMIVNVNWTRPMFDVTNMESTTVERGE